MLANYFIKRRIIAFDFWKVTRGGFICLVYFLPNPKTAQK